MKISACLIALCALVSLSSAASAQTSTLPITSTGPISSAGSQSLTNAEVVQLRAEEAAINKTLQQLYTEVYSGTGWSGPDVPQYIQTLNTDEYKVLVILNKALPNSLAAAQQSIIVNQYYAISQRLLGTQAYGNLTSDVPAEMAVLGNGYTTLGLTLSSIPGLETYFVSNAQTAGTLSGVFFGVKPN